MVEALSEFPDVFFCFSDFFFGKDFTTLKINILKLKDQYIVKANIKSCSIYLHFGGSKWFLFQEVLKISMGVS